MINWCAIDESIERRSAGGFDFPLGVYPVEPCEPKTGYAVAFESADGDDSEGEWEEWPDRYVYDVVLPARRVMPFWHQVSALLPGRVFPILDFIGHDAFREIDPYIAYEHVGIERLFTGVRRFAPFLFEDGMVGFGALSDDPFFYVFLDEHKVFTIRTAAEHREGVERLLEAFEIPEVPEPAAADAAAHEHRGVLWTPEDRADLLAAEEIVERLREDWRLVLNVNPDDNVDDDGKALGVCGWRCLVRGAQEGEAHPKYAEVYLSAGSLSEAESMAREAGEALFDHADDEWFELAVVGADRLLTAQFRADLGGLPREALLRKPLSSNRFDGTHVYAARVLG